MTFKRKTEFSEHFRVIFKGSRLLNEVFVVLGNEFSPSALVFVDVFHLVSAQVEAHPQVFRAQRVVEVGKCREMLGGKSPIERVQSFHTAIFALDVGTHETHVWSQSVEKSACKRFAEHGDADVRILSRQRTDNRHRHRHVAHRRKANNQQMLYLHDSNFFNSFGKTIVLTPHLLII